MPITYLKNVALFDATVGVEEAETLLAWLQTHPRGKADFAACTHLHAAPLQVLMAARPAVAAWPDDADLNAWLATALGT